MDIRKTAKNAGILLAYPIAFAYQKYVLLDFSDEYVTLKKIIFVLFFILLNELVVRGRGKKPAKETYFWYGIMAIVAVTYETGLADWVSFIGLHLCAMYVAIVSNRLWYEGRTGSFIIADLFNSGIIKAFGGFPNLFKDLGSMRVKDKTSETSEQKKASGPRGSVVGGILIVIVMIPIFCIAVALLSEINPFFGKMVEDLLDNINFKIVPLDVINFILNNMGYVIFAVPTSLYLYGMLSKSADSDGEKEKRSCEGLIRWRQKCRRISPVVSSVIAGLFVALYLVFFVYEGQYLFSAFAGRLPEEFTAAEYARRGFFELTGIMFINMLIFLLISYFENRELMGRKASVAITCALMGESIVFAMVSFSKLALYYSRFGYTPKRLLAMWGTLIFAAGAVMVIISLLRKKDCSRAWIWFTASSFAVMSVISSLIYIGLVYLGLGVTT